MIMDPYLDGADISLNHEITVSAERVLRFHSVAVIYLHDSSRRSEPNQRERNCGPNEHHDCKRDIDHSDSFEIVLPVRFHWTISCSTRII